MSASLKTWLPVPVVAAAGSKDALFSWPRGMHKWQIVAIANTLCFFEHSDRQMEGIRSQAWAEVIGSPRFFPFQDAFAEAQDVFYVMFLWIGAFGVLVFRQAVESLNAHIRQRGAVSKSAAER